MDDLNDILKKYPAECQPAQTESLGSAGGMSGARFWRLAAPRGILVLRCWPLEHPSPVQLVFIHAVLRHVEAGGMAILPVPFSTIQGETFVRHSGRLWELAPWMPGTADYERSPSREKLFAAMTALARFHVCVADFPVTPPRPASNGPAPAVVHRLTRLRELESNGGVLSRGVVESTWPELVPLAREFVAMLPRVVPGAVERLQRFESVSLPLQVCLRDVWHDHLLFAGDQVTGMIDFGAIGVDTPATDVARLLGSLVGDEEADWRKGIDAYARVRTLSAAERALIHALDAAGTILAGCNWIRWIYVEGRRFDEPKQVVARFERLVVRARLLANR